MRAEFEAALRRYEDLRSPLPGIAQDDRRTALVEQLVDSARRHQYFEVLTNRRGGPAVTDPKAAAFNPLHAAILHDRAGDRDEAFWLVFLFIHFGKHPRSGWRLIADIYGQLEGGARWSWASVRADVHGFRQWLADHSAEIKRREPHRGFGNHRKYESLDAWSDNGTGSIVASYVDWVGPAGHDARIAQLTAAATTPTTRFRSLYVSIKSVSRFGRTGAFDYCTTVSKLGLLSIEPDSACLVGATGPLRGARLLLCAPGQTLATSALEAALVPLKDQLGVGFDVIEDALCNWQKSPADFRPFRG